MLEPIAFSVMNYLFETSLHSILLFPSSQGRTDFRKINKKDAPDF